MAERDPFEFETERARATQVATARARPPGAPPAPPGTGASRPPGGGPVGYRMWLLRSYLPEASRSYQRAMAGGARDPVVVVADLNDPRTRRVPVELRGERGKVEPPPVSIVVLSLERDRLVGPLRALSAAAGEAARERQPGTFLVLVAGAGGFSFAQVTLPEER